MIILSIFLYLLFFLATAIMFLIAVYLVYSFFCEFSGAPFVPTKRRVIGEILQQAKLKKGQVFYELGSGDGRVARFAAKKYHVKATGFELNLLLVIYSVLMAKLQHLNNVSFIKRNVYKVSLKNVDVLFLFLLPGMVKKLETKILDECKNGTLIIAHGFKIPYLEKNLVGTIPRNIFPTYYYKIKKKY